MFKRRLSIEKIFNSHLSCTRDPFAAGCGEGSSQDIDNKPSSIDVQENPKVEEQPVVETPKEQKVEEKDKESRHIIIKNRRFIIQ